MNENVVVPEITPDELNERFELGRVPVLLDVRELFEREIVDLPDYGQLSIPCLLYTSPSPRDRTRSRMPSSA